MYRNENPPYGSVNQEDLHLVSDLYGFEVSSIVEVYYLPIVFALNSNIKFRQQSNFLILKFELRKGIK